MQTRPNVKTSKGLVSYQTNSLFIDNMQGNYLTQKTTEHHTIRGAETLTQYEEIYTALSAIQSTVIIR